MHGAKPAQSHQLSDAAGVGAIGLDRHGLERRAHVPRLEQLDRQAGRLQAGKEPLRQRPGFQANDCIVLARNEKQDRLICITGHLGQGHLESGVAEMLFTQDFSKRIDVSLNYFVRAEDSIGAYGANVVECKEASVYFSLAKLDPGPRPNTVAVDIAYADKDTIQTACTKGFPRPKEIFGEPGPGKAYVPPGQEKNARFVSTSRPARPCRKRNSVSRDFSQNGNGVRRWIAVRCAGGQNVAAFADAGILSETFNSFAD